MKRLWGSIFFLFCLVCAGDAQPLDSMLVAASFPKNANDLTFRQRMDVLAADYDIFDTVFDSNGVCIQNCQYSGITLEEYEKNIELAAAEVQQDIENNQRYASIQGTVPAGTEYHGMSDGKVNDGVMDVLAERVLETTGLDVSDNESVLQRLEEFAVAALQQTDDVLMSSSAEFVNLKRELTNIAASTQNSKLTGDSDKELVAAITNVMRNAKFRSPDTERIDPPSEYVDIPTECPIKPNTVKVNSEWGCRCHPIKKRWINHSGMDLNIKFKPVYAAAGGTVSVYNNSGGYGKYLKIQHANGYTTLYGHLQNTFVKNGAKVTAGQKIATSGNSGGSTGAHLHFEVLKNGVTTNPRNIIKCLWNPSNNTINLNRQKCTQQGACS